MYVNFGIGVFEARWNRNSFQNILSNNGLSLLVLIDALLLGLFIVISINKLFTLQEKKMLEYYGIN
jgi:hypothetical protein